MEKKKNWLIIIESEKSVLLFRNMLLPQSQDIGDPGEPMF